MIRGPKRLKLVACTAFMVSATVAMAVAAEELKVAPAEKSARPGQILGSFMTGGQIWSSAVHHKGTVYIGSVESSGVYEDGVLYMGSSDALTLFAFDGATGRVTWKYRTGGWSWCTPSISGETIYIGSISAFPYYFEGVTLERGLHAVDLKTGTARWVLPTGQLPGWPAGFGYAYLWYNAPDYSNASGRGGQRIEVHPDENLVVGLNAGSGFGDYFSITSEFLDTWIHGAIESDNRFSAVVDELALINLWQWELTFDGDTVTLSLVSLAGGELPATVTGTLAR